jgi:hypothetical protein
MERCLACEAEGVATLGSCFGARRHTPANSGLLPDTAVE